MTLYPTEEYRYSRNKTVSAAFSVTTTALLIGRQKRKLLSLGYYVSHVVVMVIHAISNFILASNSGGQLASLNKEYEELQTKIIERDAERSELQVKINKLHTAQSLNIGPSMGRSTFYTETKTPEQWMQDIIKHCNDFHRTS